MPIKDIELEIYASVFHDEVKEIFVLMSDSSSGASMCLTSWEVQAFFLAYIDIASNELKMEKGRINWLISEEERTEKGCDSPYYLQKGGIYRLKIRKMIEKTLFSGILPPDYNRFMLVEVLEENVQNKELLDVLTEYRKPVIISDKILGEFTLNKDLVIFEGKISWLKSQITISMKVKIDDKNTWTKSTDALLTLFKQQEQNDLDFRNFAAEELIDLANDWRAIDDDTIITQENFVQRISLSELSVTSDGDYIAYYNDDDMFMGHAVAVYGNNKTGIESASIE
jgi:hypothetical protein